MALTLSEVREYKALALAHSGKRGSEIILRLLDELREAHEEIVTLRFKVADMYGEYDDYTPCPFGTEWKGCRLKDVGWEWLQWWYSKNMDRQSIINEMDYGPFPKRKMATKKLRLHDYVRRRYAMNGNNGNGSVELHG
jgi:hypothetical protein